MLVAVGDVHGRNLALSRLLGAILPEIGHGDALIFLGDYIDRGPGSRQVVETILNLNTKARVVTLMGNHEDLALEAKRTYRPRFDALGLFLPENDAAYPWLTQGGWDTLASYGLDPERSSRADLARWTEFIPDEHWTFMRDAAIEFATDLFLFVHAGVLPPGRTWEYADDGVDPRLWIREEFLTFEGDLGGRRVVFGHTPQRSGRPLVRANKIGIDTAAAYGGPLTAVRLHETGEVIDFVQATDTSVGRLKP